MKQLLLLFSLLIFSCSAEDSSDIQPNEPKATHVIYVMDKCPNHDSITGYLVDAVNYQTVNNKIKGNGEYCIYISFTNIAGKSIDGYYGGQQEN